MQSLKRKTDKNIFGIFLFFFGASLDKAPDGVGEGGFANARVFADFAETVRLWMCTDRMATC